MLTVAAAVWSNGFFNDLANPLLWTSTMVLATPLILASAGGVLSERSGVVNIALEGQMLIGAFFGFFTTDHMVNQFQLDPALGVLIGVLGAIAAGLLVGAIQALVCVRFGSNQVVLGMAVNLLAIGLTTYLFATLYASPSSLPGIDLVSLGSVSHMGFLDLGQLLFAESPLFYAAIAAVLLIQAFLFWTKAGLRLRAAGENPAAAASSGVGVARARFLAFAVSGGLSGLAGAYLSLNQTGLFTDLITQGKGFIALAAVIVGRWTPFGALGASLLFGFGLAWAQILQGTTFGSFTLSLNLAMLIPFVVTLIAMAGLMGRAAPPAADGLPYRTGEEA